MNNKTMGKIFKKVADNLDGERGAWEVTYKERIMLVLTDETNNRMRIFTPIAAEEEVGTREFKIMLEANFHSALDAKYSLYNGYIISVYTHPLQELNEEQLIDALSQVAVLANNFGTTYSSTDLLFGVEQEESEEKRINKSPSGKKEKGS
ncbi:MAG: type III secretion system chaperone [Saprospiraceae bacterium]